MSNNSELSRLQDIHESEVENNEEMEQSFNMNKGELRSRVSLFCVEQMAKQTV